MEISKEDFEKLRKLEESLWRAETRFDQRQMDRTFAPGFFEFGRSGRTYTREEVLSMPNQEINATLPLRDFVVHPISADVALVTYISEVAYDTLELANRSSIWLRTADGWRLKFHQGTPITR